MEELIANIESIFKDADNAFSYCAMPFDRRMEKVNEWNRLLCPENVRKMLDALKEKDEEIEDLGGQIAEMQEHE